jgi:hypothetical protein
MFSVIAYNDQKLGREAIQSRREAHVIAEALAQFIENSDVIDPSADLTNRIGIAQTILDRIEAQIAA